MGEGPSQEELSEEEKAQAGDQKNRAPKTGLLRDGVN